MKHNKTGLGIELLFILLQTILYITFLIFDITGCKAEWSNYVKFSIIILCFCFALFCGKSADKSILFCIRAGLLFTVFSDLFLLILDFYNYGVLSFILVQQLYGLRLILTEIDMQSQSRDNRSKQGIIRSEDENRKHKILRKWFLRISIQVFIALTVCLLLKFFGVEIELLLVVSSFYFVCILTNTFTAIRQAVRFFYIRSILLFAVGMGLFLLCDINVGLFNLSGFITLPQSVYERIYSVSAILMWTFYAPSQILIALSANTERSSK